MDNTDWDLISSYAGLLCLASISIFAGAHGSISTPKKKSAKGSPQSLLQDDDDDDEDSDGISDRLSAGDAWLFPVVGSVALCGIYAIVKYFGKEWINWILAWYFLVAGVGGVWKSAVSLVRSIIGHERWNQFDRTRVLILRGPREMLSVSFRTPTIMLFPLALVPSILYSMSEASRKSAMLTNILGLSFSHNALSLIKIDSFKTGCILLSGLFFYDIYWVFGTDVMVTVATSLDVPIKLLWPKSLEFSSGRGYTMLGLGDIIIPGTFIGLALRYDYARFLRSASSSQGTFSKPYFYATLGAYIAGLVITMTVMHVFGKAQPALLYLSPACMVSLIATGLYRGELVDAWNWMDEVKQPEKDGEKKTLKDVKGNEGSKGTTDGHVDGETKGGKEVVEQNDRD